MADELETPVDDQLAEDFGEPSYEIPAAVGRAADDQVDPSVSADATPAPAPASGVPPAVPAAPEAPAPDPVLAHPAVQAIVATLERQNQALQAALLRQQAPTADAAPAPVDERPEEDVELENRMLERIPFLRDLKALVTSQNYQHLLGMAERAPQFNDTVQQFNTDVATRARDVLVTGFAHRRGLDPATVSQDDSAALIDTFLTRVGNDPRLQARFNAGDLRVVDEVMSREYQRWGLAATAPAAPVVTPAASSAAIAARAAGARNLPRSAGNALPPPSGAPVVNSDDEEAVHGAAWSALQGLRAPQ